MYNQDEFLGALSQYAGDKYGKDWDAKQVTQYLDKQGYTPEEYYNKQKMKNPELFQEYGMPTNQVSVPEGEFSYDQFLQALTQYAQDQYENPYITSDQVVDNLKKKGMTVEDYYNKYKSSNPELMKKYGVNISKDSQIPSFAKGALEIESDFDPSSINTPTYDPSETDWTEDIQGNELQSAWDNISKIMGQDFSINLDPEGKWKVLEDIMIQDAKQAYDPDKEVGRAMADFASQQDLQQRQMIADMRRRGMSEDAIAQAIGQGVGTSAAQRAGLMDQARYSADDRSRQVRNAALGYGLESKNQELQRIMSEHDAQQGAAGLGLQGAQAFDNHLINKANLGLQQELGKGELALGYDKLGLNKDLDIQKMLLQDKFNQANNWLGVAKLGQNQAQYDKAYGLGKSQFDKKLAFDKDKWKGQEALGWGNIGTNLYGIDNQASMANQASKDQAKSNLWGLGGTALGAFAGSDTGSKLIGSGLSGLASGIGGLFG